MVKSFLIGRKNGDEDAKFAINTLMENLADGITNITADF